MASDVQQQWTHGHGVACLRTRGQLLQHRRQPAQHQQQGAAQTHAAPHPAWRLAA